MMTRAPSRTTHEAEQLVRGVEILLGKLSDPTLELPLPMMARLERALHLGHRANITRCAAIEDRVLRQEEREDAA